MGRIKILYLFVLLVSSGGYSQSLERSYEPIKSKGNIPEDFLMSTRKKVEGEIKQIEEKVQNNKLLRQDYAYHSNYAIDKQLHGGNILLNDELTIYVNKVVDQLLINDKDLRSKLKVFVIKNPEVNAYCMEKGYLFVNIGLLSKVSSEAELAFVLAHEISHYIKGHNFNTYTEYDKIDQAGKKNTFEDRMIQKLTFSKENETEADTLGYRIFSGSGYSHTEVIHVFDMLKYSYLPFEEIRFDTTFFNDKNYTIPGKYFLTQVQALKDDEEDDDSKSTHPNIRKRKKSIEVLVDSTTKIKEAKFLVSESEFFKMRDIARFETCRLYLIERSYLHSIFSAYILLKKFPENSYLPEVISKSLFAMTLYKNNELRYNEDSYRKGPIPDFSKTEGFSQQLNFMIDRIPQKEMAVLALRYVWETHRKYPDEILYQTLSDSLFAMLTQDFGSGIKEYYDHSSIDGESNEYYRYAFVDYFKSDPEFKKKFEEHSARINLGKTEGLKVYKKVTVTPKVAPKKKYDVKKIIIVDPSYQRHDETITGRAMYSITDARHENLLNALKKQALGKDIEYILVDPGNWAAEKIQFYNDFSVLTDWFNERMEGGMNQSCPVLNSDEIPELIERYGTKYVLWPGVISIRQKSGRMKPIDMTFYYSILFDLETGKVISSSNAYSEKNDDISRINGYVKNTFKKIRELNSHN